MLDNQTAQPASDTSAGGQTASAAPVENLDAALERVYDEMQKPASAPAADIKADTRAPASLQNAEKAQADLANPASDEPDTEADTPEPIRPPHTWSQDNQKWFGQLSRAHQEYIAKREAEAHAKITQQGQTVRQWEPVRQAIDEYRHAIPQGKEAETVRNLLAAQDYLDHNPVDGLLKLAEAYKVNPQQLAQAMGLQAPPRGQQADNQEAIDDLFKDPRYDKVVPEVQALKRQLYQVQQQLQQRQSMESSQRQRAAELTINDFAKDKPHWDSVAEEVVGEVALLKQQNPGAAPKDLLEKAYDRAIWKNPEIRQRILDDQRKADEAKAAKEAAKAAAEAKKLASMNVRSGASASTGTFDGRWDDNSQLEAIYDRVASR